MAHLHLHVDDDVATLALANPPQNRIGREMADDLARAVQQIGASGGPGPCWSRQKDRTSLSHTDGTNNAVPMPEGKGWQACMRSMVTGR